MAISPLRARRFAVAVGVAAAIAASPAALATLTTQATPARSLASCPNGESEDTYTGVCVPDVVPNSPSPFQAIPGNPSLPALNMPGSAAIPCNGTNTGECIGLSEEQQAQGPQPVPQSTVGGSPTVTGHIG